MMIGTGANAEIYPSFQDLNPIIDIACPRSVGGINAAARLASAMNIPFKLHELDCEPFFHGYGPSCSDKNLVFAVWNLQITDIYGEDVDLPFYICEGDGPLLLGNHLVHKSMLDGLKNLLIIPPNVAKLSKKRIAFSTYTVGDPGSLYTYLNVVPAYYTSIKSLFST